MRYTVTLSLLLLTPLALGACSNAKEQLGISKKPPDEFAVIKRAPLSMPPDYRLRPPSPGTPRPQEQTTSEQASQVVFGNEQKTQPAPLPSDGESLLLHQAGATEPDPQIRQKVDKESLLLRDRNIPVAQKLLGIGGDSDEISATVVNAPEEAERLKQNAEEGKPVTEGETPSIEE